MVQYNQCHFCCRFMSYTDMDNGVIWSPYGHCLDLEPPPDERAHRSCWDMAAAEHRALIIRTAHYKPVCEGVVLEEKDDDQEA